MDELVTQDKLNLKRVDNAIKRISSSGIILIGVDTQKLSDSFENYFVSTHNLHKLLPTNEILKNIAYHKERDKTEFLFVNTFNHPEQKDIVNHLQFQRDYIYEQDIKIVVLLSNEMLDLLQEKGDLFSTVKYSHTFYDHSVDNKFEEKNEKLNKAIKDYEDYLLQKVKHNNILFDLTFVIGMEAYRISDYSVSLVYFKKALSYTDGINQKFKIYSELGNIYNDISRYDKSINYSNKLLKIAKKHNTKEAQAIALNNLANSYDLLNKSNVALKYHNDSLKLEKEIGNKNGIAISLENIGKIYFSQSNYEQALKYQNDSLKIKNDIGNKRDIANSLSSIGIVYYKLADFDKALKYQKDSLKIEKEIGNKSGIANSLGNISNIYSELADYDKALEYQNDSLKIQKEIGSKRGIATSLGNIGSLYYELADFDKALKYLNDSLKIQKEIGSKSGIASSLANIGLIYYELADFKKALEYQKDSLKIEKEIGNKSGIASSLGNIGLIYSELADFDKAFEYQNDSLEIQKNIGNKSGIASSLNDIGNINKKLKQYDLAYKKFNEALKIAKKHKIIRLKANILADMADCYKADGKISEAKTNFTLSRHLYEAIGLKDKVSEIQKELEGLK